MDDFLERLQAQLTPLTDTPACVVGLSGGVDSVVLLHALRELAAAGRLWTSLRALHVNHGLHAQATDWEAFCGELCADLGVSLNCRRVEVADSGSLEAAARDARYAVFTEVLGAGEALLLAQHLDDQLETLLLRLLRGAGPAGLAGMPQRRELGAGFLYRPLLQFTREDIHHYARTHDLRWIDDPANADHGHDRNFLRHRVLPLVAERWPAYRQSWHKSQSLLREADGLLDELAAEDLTRCGNHSQSGLDVAALNRLTEPRRRNLLRHWFGRLGLADPGWHTLHQLCLYLGDRQAEADSAFALDELNLQVTGGYVYALRLPPPPRADGTRWNAVDQALLALPDNGQLQARQRFGRGLGRVHADSLEIRYRQGGETIRLPGRPTKSLKKLLQEESVPPWLRERLPLLYQDDRLVCVPGIGPLRDCAAKPGEEGIVIDWHAPDFALRPA